MTESEGLSICIPIEPPEHGGGGFRFLRNFEAFLDRSGIIRTRRVTDRAAVLFANSWQVRWPRVLLAAWLNPMVTVVHRVDGAAADYGRDPGADREQAAVNRLADLTIFQSEYCRFSTREKFPVIRNDGPVIHNPVDVDVFRPDGPCHPLPASDGARVCAVTWSTNPRKGVPVLYRLARGMPETQFVLVGRFDDAPEVPNVVRVGVLDAHGVANVLRACDALVTFSQNEACPNVVLEALASGLPVLYLDSGAARELVFDCGLPVTEQTFAPSLAAALSRRAELGACSRERAVRHFHPGTVFSAYLEQIQRSLRTQRSGRVHRVRAMAEALAAARRS